MLSTSSRLLNNARSAARFARPAPARSSIRLSSSISAKAGTAQAAPTAARPSFSVGNAGASRGLASLIDMPNSPRGPLAPLETIDFGRLESNDLGEMQKLLRCCQTHGFFYLDLQTCDNGRQILEDEQGLLEFMRNYFDKPHDVKMLDNRNHPSFGFKPVGLYSGVKENSRDSYETLKIQRAEMVEKSANLPSGVKTQIELFDSFMSLSHHITHTLMRCLSDGLGLTGSRRLEQSHRDGEETNTTLVLLHYPPTPDADRNVGHNKHTDIGSITLLFSEQWGLQVLTPEKREWAFVQPRPKGHATINVGDSLRFLADKKLYSCLHRVVPPAGEDAAQDESRYSIAYFLRPENKTVYKDPQGRPISAAEWHDKKYVMFAEPHDEQAKSPMLTGGMESILQK